MRSKVPSDVDVFLEKTQVKAAGRDIPDITQVTRIDDLLNSSHGGRIEESMADHQPAILILALPCA
jgi:hypothetical protein